MSGLMRGMIDQVLKSMGEDERAQQVNYVTDKMVEKMSNPERVDLLMAILDRVMSNLSSEERVDLAGRVAERLGSTTGAATVVTETDSSDPMVGVGGTGRGEVGGPTA